MASDWRSYASTKFDLNTPKGDMSVKEQMLCVPRMGDIVPAAQYLRMSDPLQRYSIDNQIDAIQVYAELKGFRIVKTYADVGKTGLLLAPRCGLQRLLQDVLKGTCDYRAILVYDITRFGRFQDPDEAAHYEFQCKMAGVPIHYCAEIFDQTFGIEKSVLKAVKRVMAAEYSRERSAREIETKIRMVQRGFWVGGNAGYGLHRAILSPGTTQAQVLKRGQWKALQTERAILTPGPAEEVTCVRNMFRMAIEGMTATEITRQLNNAGSTFYGSLWNRYTVARILSDSKYAGDNIWRRTTVKLGSPWMRVPKTAWAIKRDAFEPVIDRVSFNKAQVKLSERAYSRSSEQLLADLRRLLDRTNYLARAVINKASDLACAETYFRRFGSLRTAYHRIGYSQTVPQRVVHLKQMRRLRSNLLQSIADLYPGQTRLIQKNGRARPILVFENTVHISLLLARCDQSSSGLRWRVAPIGAESKLITLICLSNITDTDFAHFWVLSSIDRNTPFLVDLSDPWLQRGRKLGELRELRSVVMEFARGKG